MDEKNQVIPTVRTCFLVDGFNLYHSLRGAQKKLAGGTAKWLNLRSFCGSYLREMSPSAVLGDVHYFTALAKHMEARKPDVTQRHKRYIRCLEDTGVVVERGKFKKKWVRCYHCTREMDRHEEKETDVAIGVRLVEVLLNPRFDAAVLVTGDSDLAPAIRTAKRLCPGKPIFVVMPFGRARSFDLRELATKWFKVKKERYTDHQFTDPHVLKDGTSLSKPPKW